jgi:tetratricopeptide (TPR) repeat protein
LKTTKHPVSDPLSAEVELVRRAIAGGRLDEGADRCRALLKTDVGSAEVLGLLGEIEYKRGKLGEAAELLEKALAKNRRHARSHWVLGNISQDQGNLDRAITAYRRALRADSLLAEGHNDLGTAYFAKAWHLEAEQCYRRALELQPENFAAAENLAAALRAQGKLREARDAFIRALKLRIVHTVRRLFRRKPRVTASAPSAQESARSQMLAAAQKQLADRQWSAAERTLREWLSGAPDDPEALHLLGRALAENGKRDEAIASLERAIALRSSVPEFFVTLGNVLTSEREYVKAIESYQLALMLDPGHGAATGNIARVLHELGHFREAEEIYRLSLQHDPDIAAAHSSLAGTLLSLGRYAEAEAAARKAIALSPRSIHALVMLANALIEQGSIEEGCKTIRKAEDIDPANAELLRWQGMLEMVFKADFERAESILRRGSVIAPQDGNIHINLARCLLIRERFAEGWEEYEWRRHDPTRAIVYTKLPYPEWDGASPLEGRTIVVNGEQGLGDEVMFASCLAELAGRARRCVLYCNFRLESLFRRSFPFADVIGGSHLPDKNPFPVLPEIDCQVAAGSLPRTFRRSAADFPDHRGYLKAAADKIAKWRDRLAALGPGLKVGLSWKGGTPLSDVTRRTLKLEQLQALFRLPGTHWISLQYGDCAAEREAFASGTGVELHHWQEAIDDLDETAALMCALDLRISVCNTQVHLSGALGKEVWVLAPLSPDWRYGHTGERMLWYPAARMFRQVRFGEWPAVVSQIARELAKRVGT